MKRGLFYFLASLIAIFCFGPLIYLFTIPTVDNYTTVFSSDQIFTAIKNTLILCLSVAIICTLVGTPLAWLLTRTNLKGKAIFRSLYCLPYAIPPFIGAIGWIVLANPNSGILNQWLGLGINIYTFPGLIFVESTFLFTFVLITALASMDQMDPSLEEAARLSGASGWQVFTDIAIPIMKPAILSGFLLSFLATAASFGVPALIGGPARIYFFTTQIYSYQRMGTQSGLQASIALSVALALATFLLLLAFNFFRKEKSNFSVSGKSSRASLVDLGKWNWVFAGSLSFILFIILILPLFAVALSAFSQVQGDWQLSQLTFENFQRVLFETEETKRAIFQSLGLAFSASAVATLISFVFCYFSVREQRPASKWIIVLTSLSFSTPGTVLAIAFILSFSQGLFGWKPFGIEFSLYNTLFLIGLIYAVKYLSLSLKTMSDGYRQIHPSLEEAATVCGASWPRRMIQIYWPLLRTTIIASVFLVFMPSLSELTMTVLLTGPGLETIGSLIFQLQEYSDMAGGGAAVLSILVVLIVLVLNYSLKLISKGRYGF